MLTLNKEKQPYSLVLASKKDLETEVIKQSQQVAVLNQNDNKIYLKIDFNYEDQRVELVNKLTTFIQNNALKINVDVDSFVQELNFEEEKVFNTLVETFGIIGHQPLLMKKADKTKIEPVLEYNLITTNEKLVQSFAKEMVKVEATNYARDLQDTPPNIATSEWIANKIVTDAKEFENVKVSVYGLKEAQKMNMGLLLAVNAGSHVEPKVVVVEYNSDSTLPKTALVGKGITFDSGGYNLKTPGKYLKDMKYDMSGAAIMVSTVFGLAKAKVKANVVAVAMLTDNRIGGHATLPESVVQSMNGLTVQIDDTDAEGRLVLADGITFGIRQLQADQVIDVATLTGSIVYALGKWQIGAFTKSDALWDEFKLASDYTGEGSWRMPLHQGHTEIMKDTLIADLTNAEPDGAGAYSSTAAAFLHEFSETKPFLHLDIAGMDSFKGRGTGVMVRTLIEMLGK